MAGFPAARTLGGRLPEAADGYDGAIFVKPGDSATLTSGIMTAAQMAGRRFSDPRDWSETVKAICAVGIAGTGDLPD